MVNSEFIEKKEYGVGQLRINFIDNGDVMYYYWKKNQ